MKVGDTEGDGAGGEAALVIAEDAFRAGFKAALDTAITSKSLKDAHVTDNFWQIAETLAWNAFEPSEAAKDVA